MIIKNFKREDEEVFLSLCREFYDSHSTLRPFNDGIAKKTFKRIMAKHENLWGYLFTDKITGEAIGYSLITSYWCNEEGGNVVVLDELYIKTTDRHKGYATAFIEWLNNRFRKKAVSITLEVLTTNVDATNLYVKEGFKPDGFTTYTKEIK